MIEGSGRYVSHVGVRRAKIDWTHGSKICTAFFEHGELQGKPCNRVLR